MQVTTESVAAILRYIIASQNNPTFIDYFFHNSKLKNQFFGKFRVHPPHKKILRTKQKYPTHHFKGQPYNLIIILILIIEGFYANSKHINIELKKQFSFLFEKIAFGYIAKQLTYPFSNLYPQATLNLT